MTDNFDLGSAADWSQRVSGLARPTRVERDDAGRARDLRLVGEVAVRGPRSADEAARITADQSLQQLLHRAWVRHPPSDTLRDRLAADPAAGALRDLLPSVAEAQPSDVTAFDDWDLALFVELLDVGVSRADPEAVTRKSLSGTVEGGVVVGVTYERGAWRLTLGGSSGPLRVHVRWSDGTVTTNHVEPRTARRPVALEPPDPRAQPVSVWVEGPAA